MNFKVHIIFNFNSGRIFGKNDKEKNVYFNGSYLWLNLLRGLP
jgi:hypothetical protein